MTAAGGAGAALGCALPLGALAVLRARALGDDLQRPWALGVIAVVVLGSAWFAHADPLEAVVLAYAGVCAWTDVCARHVYLPVSWATGLLIAAIVVAAGTWPGALVGAVALGGGGLALHYGTRRAGLGLGDATNWALVGAGVGWYRGVWAVGVGAAIGAVVLLALIARGVLPRTYRVPMAMLTFVGTSLVTCARAQGPQ